MPSSSMALKLKQLMHLYVMHMYGIIIVTCTVQAHYTRVHDMYMYIMYMYTTVYTTCIHLVERKVHIRKYIGYEI